MKAMDDNTDMPLLLTGCERNRNDSAPGGDFDLSGSEMNENQNYTGSIDGDNTFTSLGGEDYYDLEED